jgi:hypothetical protein
MTLRDWTSVFRGAFRSPHFDPARFPIEQLNGALCFKHVRHHTSVLRNTVVNLAPWTAEIHTYS